MSQHDRQQTSEGDAANRQTKPKSEPMMKESVGKVSQKSRKKNQKKKMVANHQGSSYKTPEVPPNTEKEALPRTCQSEDQSPDGLEQQHRQNRLIDIGVNLTNSRFRKNWREVVSRAAAAGVDRMVLTGVDLKSSRQSLAMAETWLRENGNQNLFVTVGVHPHHANQFNESTLDEMKALLLEHPLAVAVGECGLDYHRNYSTPDEQTHAFRQQVILACQLQKPLFLHERDAHEDLMKILNDIDQDPSIPPLPPVMVHCFTGTQMEANSYVDRGFYLSFAGTICKFQRGAPLRALLPGLPLDRVMVETDAPFMGFRKDRRYSEPEDTVGVASKLAETVERPYAEVCHATTSAAVKFFNLE